MSIRCCSWLLTVEVNVNDRTIPRSEVVIGTGKSSYVFFGTGHSNDRVCFLVLEKVVVKRHFSSGHVMVRGFRWGSCLAQDLDINELSPLASVVGEYGLDLEGQAVSVLFLCVTKAEVLVTVQKTIAARLLSIQPPFGTIFWNTLFGMETSREPVVFSYVMRAKHSRALRDRQKRSFLIKREV